MTRRDNRNVLVGMALGVLLGALFVVLVCHVRGISP
jgi:hypothetical protein